MVERQIMEILLTIKQSELVIWLEEKGVEFPNEDRSVRAIKYFMNNYFDEIVLEHLNYKGLQISEIDLELKNQSEFYLVFRTGPIYPSFHKPEQKEVMIMMEFGAQLSKLRYHEEIRLIPIQN